MKIDTHLKINQRLCGTPLEVAEGRALVEMATTEEMVADDQGLVHGGFVFGMADYAAMLSVNHPYVVLASSNCIFHKPAKLGQTLHARANVVDKNGRKQMVKVEVRAGEVLVFSGEFACFVLSSHVLT